MYVVGTIMLHYHIMQIAFSASATFVYHFSIVYHFSMPLVYPFCALFLCVSSCRPLEAGGIWGDTARGNTDKGIPFSYVLCLSTQS